MAHRDPILGTYPLGIVIQLSLCTVRASGSKWPGSQEFSLASSHQLWQRLVLLLAEWDGS